MGRREGPADFFVSYASADRAWAEWIAWELEADGYQVVIQAWDFTPGRNWAHAMQQATSTAERVVAVLSPAYLASAHGTVEWEVFYAADPLGELGRLLPVRVAEVDPPGLLRTRVYVDLVGLNAAGARAALLAAAYGTRGKPTREPAFPGQAVDPAQQHGEKGGVHPPRFPGQLPAVWNVPARNPHFTGRAEMLRELRQRLQAGEATLVVQALYGLGGVGKTQLAIEYAHRFAADYELVWWIDAEQPVLVAHQLAQLGSKLDLPIRPTVAERVELVLVALRRRARWLLVFDNAERPADIASCQPGGYGHVLVTSRAPGWGALGGRLEVDVLSRSETMALLQKRIPTLDADLADQLAAELGDLPLAAAQAAAYLEQTGLAPAQYLHRFRSRRASLLAKGDVLGYQGRLDTTWTLSMERLRTDSPAAVQLLELAAFLAPEPIPLQLFGQHPELLTEPLRSAAADPDALDDAVGAMVGFSLARRRADAFQLHRLVQAAIRQQLGADRQQATTDRVLGLLAAAHPGDPNDPASWPAYARLAPHVLVTSPLGDQRADSRQLMLGTVEYLNVRVDYRTSRQLAEALLERWRHHLGPEHPDTLSLAVHLTVALAWLEEAEQAHALGEDTLERSRRVLGPDHPTTLRMAGLLTYALIRVDEAEQARALGQDTLERSRRVLGPDHPYTLSTATALMNALTPVMGWLDEAEQARALGEDTLERCRRVLGPDHPLSLRAAALLAYILAWLDEAEQARALGQDTLERSRRVLGPDHLVTLGTASVLALVLPRSAEAEQARRLGQETLERCRRVLGPDHPVTLHAATVLVTALGWLGEVEQARRLGQETLERYRRILGPDHPFALASAAVLTVLLGWLGEVEQARRLGQDTLERYRRIVGPDHPRTLLLAKVVASPTTEKGQHQTDLLWFLRPHMTAAPNDDQIER
jgi:TIR domain/Tetratricopeptide repeat